MKCDLDEVFDECEEGILSRDGLQRVKVHRKKEQAVETQTLP